MEVSGQLHAPVALIPGKSRQVPTGYKPVWVSEPVWNLWRRKNLAHYGIRTLAFQPVAFRYTDWDIQQYEAKYWNVIESFLFRNGFKYSCI
jgi:hypothetical protein